MVGYHEVLAAGNITVRRMHWTDIQAVAALDRAAFGKDAWTEDFFWAQMATPGNYFVVAQQRPDSQGSTETAGSEGSGNTGNHTGNLETANSVTPHRTDELRPHAPAEQLLPAPRGEILGFAGIGVSGPQADILTIAVARPARGTGLGGCLLGIVIDHARTHAVEAIYLDVRADNDPALKLYARNGFEKIGARPKYYAGADALIMRKLLPVA